MPPELYRELALITDAHAELCLNGVLKGIISEHPNYKKLLVSPEDMITVISSVAGQLQIPVTALGELPPQERPKAIRLLLSQMAQDPELSERLLAWLNTSRPRLIEPVTSAIVLAGIITVLSTHFKLTYKDGKPEVIIEKKANTESIIKKFFPLFQ